MGIVHYIKWFLSSHANVRQLTYQENLKKKLDMSDKDIVALQIAEREVMNLGKER